MVVEHTFVTTYDVSEALTAASNLLQVGGFQVKHNNAFQIGNWTDLEVFRGRKTVARAKDATQCPQQLRVEFDRGRVNIAASIIPINRRGRSFRIGFGIPAMSSNTTKDPVYGELMMAITQSLELLLAQRTPPEEASRTWLAVEARIKETARRARKRNMIIWLSILGIIIALIVFIVVMANR
jgi:hypothetical protein